MSSKENTILVIAVVVLVLLLVALSFGIDAEYLSN